MEAVLQRLPRADVAHSERDHVSFARSESPSSSADHRTYRRPGLGPKFDDVDAARATVAPAGEPWPVVPVLTTRVDHQRESAPVGSVHTPLPSLPP